MRNRPSKYVTKAVERRRLKIAAAIALPILAVLAVVFLWWHDSRQPLTVKEINLTLLKNGQPISSEELIGPLETTSSPVSSWGEKRVTTGSGGECGPFMLTPGEYWLLGQSSSYLLMIPENAPGKLSIKLEDNSGGRFLSLSLKNNRGSPLFEKELLLEPFGLQGPDSYRANSIAAVTDWQGNVNIGPIPAGAHKITVDGQSYPLIIGPGEINRVNTTITVSDIEPLDYELLVIARSGKPFKNGLVDEVLYSLPSGKECLVNGLSTDENGILTLKSVCPGVISLRIENRRYKASIPEGGGQQRLLLS